MPVKIKNILFNLKRHLAQDGYYYFFHKIAYHILLKKIYPILVDILEVMIAKDNQLVIFGSRYGTKYMHNSRYLFEFINNSDGDLNAVWFTRDVQILEKVTSLGYDCVFSYSPKAILLLCRAKMIVYSYSFKDIVLQHNMLPKVIHLDLHDGQGNLVNYNDFDIYKCITSANRSYETNIPNKKYINYGFPKNDQLANIEYADKLLWDNFLSKIKSQPDFVMLYAPTKRDGTRWNKPTNLFPFRDFDFAELFNFLSKNNILLLIHLHPGDMYGLQYSTGFYTPLRKQLAILCDYENIEVTNNAFDDVNKIMPFTDLLITNYSSTAFDYLLSDNPMIHIPYNYNYVSSLSDTFETEEDRRTFDYKYSFPGPRVTNFQQFCVTVNEILRFGVDRYQMDRIILKNRNHRYSDGTSSIRICEWMKSNLKG